MRRQCDIVSKKIVDILQKAGEPLETREIETSLPSETRVKILYRLMNLRGDGLVCGKVVGSGKGTWIWWIQSKKH